MPVACNASQKTTARIVEYQLANNPAEYQADKKPAGIPHPAKKSAGIPARKEVSWNANPPTNHLEYQPTNKPAGIPTHRNSIWNTNPPKSQLEYQTTNQPRNQKPMM